MPSKLPRWSIALTAILALGIAVWYVTSDTPGQSQTAFDAPALDAGSIVNAASDIEPRPDLFIGDPDAPIEVVEYASFTCPHCANFHKNVYPQIKTNFIETGKVKFILREVYFDKFGLWAGMIARCGGEDRYFGLADLLMDKQSEWARGNSEADVVGNLFRLGRTAGMTDDQMNACVRDNDLAQALVADFQLKSGQDGVTGTPTFIINGEKMSNMSYEDFEKVLNDRLN